MNYQTLCLSCLTEPLLQKITLDLSFANSWNQAKLNSITAKCSDTFIYSRLKGNNSLYLLSCFVFFKAGFKYSKYWIPSKLDKSEIPTKWFHSCSKDPFLFKKYENSWSLNSKESELKTVNKFQNWRKVVEGQFAVDTMLFVTLQTTWYYTDMSQAFHKVCMNLPKILKM